jgi:CSLREA domain-containing protein
MSARQRRRRLRRRKNAVGRTSARSKRILLGAGLTVGVGLGLTSNAQAAAHNFTVGSLADTTGATDCETPTNTDCTLRDAIEASNDDGNPADQDVIVFASAITGSASTITLTDNPTPINQSLWIQGPGTAPGNSPITIDGDGSYRDMFARPGGNYAMNVKVSGLTLSNGVANGGGAGISVYWDYVDADTSFPQPTLTVQNSEVSGNTGNQGAGISGFRATIDIQNSIVSDNTADGLSSGVGGGGVYLFPGLGGTLTIDHSTISGNTANGVNGRGGGVHSSAPTTIESSTISNNHTSGDHALGGGLDLTGGGTIDGSTLSGNHTSGIYAAGGGVDFSFGVYPAITGSTITDNYTLGEQANGGGIYSYYNTGLTIEDTTISGNSSAQNGGGVYDHGSDPAISFANTILAGGTADGVGPDLNGDATFQASFSLFQNTSGATINETVADSNITGVDPQLGPLQVNGGPTRTQALSITSPAVDAGLSSSIIDQRGLLRPVAQGAARSAAAGANCADIGAFELQVTGGGPGAACHPGPPPPPPSGGGNPAPAPNQAKKCKKKKKSSAHIAKKCKKKKKKK